MAIHEDDVQFREWPESPRTRSVLVTATLTMEQEILGKHHRMHPGNSAQQSEYELTRAIDHKVFAEVREKIEEIFSWVQQNMRPDFNRPGGTFSKLIGLRQEALDAARIQPIKLPPVPEQDWRPTEMIPEDFHA